MKPTYEIIQTPSGNTVINAQYNGYMLSIPTDPANSDYQAYLAEQSTPIDTEDE
jgi:hypothetical protein